jgi:hypothetical protein
MLLGLSMPSIQHEVIVELFINRPSLATELLEETFDVKVPVYTEARIVSADLTQVQPPEYRADAVVLLVCKSKPVGIHIVEVQLGIDPDKRFSWPVYLATSRERHRCGVDLLVIAPDPAVAKWCAQPIEIGPRGFVLTPKVLHAQMVPVVTDVGDATARLELAVLSAMFHGQTDAAPSIVAALVPVLEKLQDKKRSTFYMDLVYHSVNEAARRAMEKMMVKGYVYTSPYAIKFFEGLDKGLEEGLDKGRKEGLDKGLKEGRKEGRKEDVVTVLRTRGIDVPEAAQQRIVDEDDMAVLERWFVRAVTASSLDEVFKETH